MVNTGSAPVGWRMPSLADGLAPLDVQALSKTMVTAIPASTVDRRGESALRRMALLTCRMRFWFRGHTINSC
jgi:hypothetical protein